MTRSDWLLGAPTQEITWWQMTVRAVIVFAYGLIAIRFAGRHAFGKSSALDIVLSVIIGSSLSRALTGNAPLVATLAAMTALVAIHAILSRLSINWQGLDILLKVVSVSLSATAGRFQTYSGRTTSAIVT
ncbi:hypothetical protein [Ensifer sp. LCM 4579]|uniref:hypothetical protein n=1 Tax=Ensifer sp. LCM 4579 TaxID=1848292 RepID=UPI0008D937AB|nr:hypothetical protein [Ensifer sp. LCM 4579]OHV74394.1 hypothetical protein LCM4579_08835 [Ensifer sp. LCM 4579]